MATLQIVREHDLGLEKAREIARKWQLDGEQDYGLLCDYTQTEQGDCIHFKRTGVEGDLRVTATTFEMEAKLGFLLSAFKERIETAVNENLDALLAEV